MELVNALITVSRSRQGLAGVLDQFIAAAQYDEPGHKRGEWTFDICYISDGAVIAGAWKGDKDAALRRREELMARPATPLNGGGRCWVEGNDFLIEVAESPTNAQMAFLAADTAPPTDIDILLQHRLVGSLAALWKQAR